jgi:hypothetical protein
MRIYSHNTRAVWQLRRTGKLINTVATITIATLAIGLFIYWVSIGRPTHVEEIPFFSQNKDSSNN